MELRKRTCSNPSPSNGGNFCFGESSEYRICFSGNCAGAVNGNWSTWEQWGHCSATCGIGMEYRNRTCSEPSSSNGGNFCFGEPSEYRLCNKGNCAGAVNGNWSIWEQWGQCSATCNTGMELRKRTCSNPSPSNGGNFCFGEPSEYRLCNKGTCAGAVNGNWSTWEPWGQCSATCNTGMELRKRTCSNPSPSNGGNFCFGEPSEYRLCNNGNCAGAVNGGWSLWDSWGPCSKTCGNGMELRKRTCSNPSPSDGGNFCFGEPSEYRLCNKGNCAEVNGGWSLWGSWSSCSASCMKARTRSCINPAPSQYGQMCQGNSEDKDSCDLMSCTMPALRIRLVNGINTNSQYGRVEISLDGTTWGTVCDDAFTNKSAEVVCRMLGFNWNSFYTSNIPGNGSIYLDDVTCSGYESTLLYCKHGGWGKHNCGHYEDVAVRCIS